MKTPLSTQAEAVIYYIQEMDVDMIDLILDKDKSYQDMPKSDFIEKLTNAIDIFKHNKNNKLIDYTGFCNNELCTNKCKNGYSFIGNHSKHIMNIILEVTNGNVQNLYECHDFMIFEKEINLENYSRIYIDEPQNGFVSGITSFF